MGTTLKHRLFSSEPMGEKAAKDLPGVGAQTAKNLQRMGCSSASAVFGVYLMLQRNRDNFVNWMKNSGKTTEHRAMQTYVCLEEYSQNFVFGQTNSTTNNRGGRPQPSNNNLHTSKHRAFISEPMGDKRVTELPGVGKASATKLGAVGITKATQILEQFLTFRKNKTKFEDWMKATAKMRSVHTMQCYECLVSYCQYHSL